MLSSWLSDWEIEWKRLWEILWFDLKGWLKYSFWWNAFLRAMYWGWVKDDLEDIADHIVEACEHYANAVVTPIEEWVLSLLGLEEEPGTSAYDHISNIWDSIVALWARFGYDITNTTKTVVQWVREEIEDAFEDYDPNTGIIWDSIVALWARFGYDITNTTLTVVQWVQQEYDTAKDQANAAATWIATTGDPVARWVTNYGPTLYDWLKKYAGKAKRWLDNYSTYYIGIYDNHRTVLTSFLQDPGAFIAGYVEDYLEGTEEKPGPAWWASLLAFLLNPIGWLLAQFAKWHKLVAAWITEWLDENFLSLDEMIDAIEPPDLGLPDVMAWAKGLREPETDEEIAYVAYLDEKLQHILDDILPDKPPVFVG